MGSLWSPYKRNMALLWQLFALILILQAVGSRLNTNAKQHDSDLSLDDDIDIDRIQDSNKNTHLINASQLDKQAFIEDELQFVKESDMNASETETSWFINGVRRVRRELSRLFGGDSDDHLRKLNKKLKRKHNNDQNDKLRRDMHHGHAQKQRTKRTQKQHKKKATQNQTIIKSQNDFKHNKRATLDEYEEGSGALDEDEVLYYRTRITLHEPYINSYSEGNSNQDFQKLHRDIESSFTQIFNEHYDGIDDIDFNLRATVLKVLPTDDSFKINAVVQLELPARINDFEEVLRQYISHFNRLGPYGAEINDQFYFRQVRESNESIQTSHPAISNGFIDEASGDGTLDQTPGVVPQIGGCRGDAFYVCPVSGIHICDVARCDGREDCPDGEDEQTCENDVDTSFTTVCSDNTFKCDERCLPNELKCNGVIDCIDHFDEQNCLQECQANEYKCSSGLCIEGSRRCDHVNDCPDGDDEGDDCRCASNQFRCRNGDCVPQNAYCDGYAQCRDNSDEADCTDGPECTATQFRCDNGQCVNSASRCDGYTDCHDSSDEKNCRSDQEANTSPQLNLKTYPDSQIIKESREVIFRCRDEGPLRAKVKWSRPGGRPLPIGFNDKNGRLEIPNIRVEDSGTYVCEAVGYPRHVPGQQVTVHLTVERYNVIDDRPPSACHPSQATCMNGDCIDKSQICDGKPHCSDGSDEHSCSHGRKCHPNQFLCHNSKCIERVWRCDGENDCGDNSDEESCDPEPSGAPCRFSEYQCRSGHCIPKSFQCDDLTDCIDGTDEIGCMAPVPIRPPPPRKVLDQGEALNLTCVATGVPVPMIVWRLNWGHVPDKCVSKSHSGTGNLYCPTMEQRDSGAYSCEIINTRGTTFVTPDTLVTINEPKYDDVCPAGFFNMLARHQEECINCFCFGISNTCKSADFYIYAIQPPITSHRVVNVQLSPYSNIVINEAPSSGILSLHHGIQFRASDVPYGSRETPYLALPADYMGKQLKSYGGALKYEVNYMGTGRPLSAPDVIITGNGFTLTHRGRTLPNINNKVNVPFVPGNWFKPDGRKATREEIMMILANVDNILIRLGYIDATEREVELTNIIMDSASSTDQNLGFASLVEKCACPHGYIGDSCESCAPGFVRQAGGPWLGRCIPFAPEPCPSGTYGDPRRGIPCRECPCPQTGSNSFANGCQLSPDGDVICNCYEGFIGRRCETCAPGYNGNPLLPGGYCHKAPETSCNTEGTYHAHANGTCECKPLAEGPLCDTCAPRSFHLNSFTYTGCIECFCSGLMVECNSSSWYRDKVSSNFGHTRAPHGFSLIRDYDSLHPSSVQFETLGSALKFSHEPNTDTLYWSLPAQFLGNKITAYGGKLIYTISYQPLPGGQMSRNTAPDVVIKSGEDVALVHYRKSAVSPSTTNSYVVPIIESAWQRSDGAVFNREHLLMALTQIESIFIKATYTTNTKDGSIIDVVLDTATPTNIGTKRAWEVEECRCPAGYVGLSCERCAPGYKRNPEEGLYLGLCEPCDCNGHSTHCDAETGECLDCTHNTEGKNCERCISGYSGNPSSGTIYDCQPDKDDSGHGVPPSPSNQTECTYCSHDGTVSCEDNYCHCKTNVVGTYCDQCRPGTYGISAQNPLGCKECFCSGQSSQCRSASLYRQLIPVDFISNAPLLTDDEGEILDRDNLSFDVEKNMYVYSYTSYTPRYWSLRGSVLGNQLYSYGGQLLYTLTVESFGRHERGNDVILIGNGVKLVWSRPVEEHGNKDYQVRLNEDAHWQRLDRGRAVPATRNDFMTVLSKLEHILIRATPEIPTTRTSIRDVILESAVEHPTPNAKHAIDVELCNCPLGYIGNSCENCAALHYRDQNGNCQACPCQEDVTQSCYLGESGYVDCQCKQGHSGDRCQNIDDYTSETTSTQQPDFDYRTQITVSIAPPEITIIPVGGSLTLSCSGRFNWNNHPVVVSWYKLNGRLPYEAEIDGGLLHLYNLQIADSGVYICQALLNQTSRVYEDKVSLTISENALRSPAHILNLPQYVSFEEYQQNEINCEVSGNPSPTITWTRVDGQMSREARTEDTRLIFDTPRKSDEGSYRCQAFNNVGNDEKYTQVYVRQSAPKPTQPPRDLVYIEPQRYNGEPGENVRLVCQPTSSLTLIYEWSKDGYPIDRQQNVVINGNVLEIRGATVRDSGKYTCLASDQRNRRNFTDDAHIYIEDNRPYVIQPQPGTTPPVIVRLAQENRILQGQDFSITCEANGTPYPTIKWTKVHESLAVNVHQTGNVLRIINAKPDNRGIYLCIAENAHGSDQSSTAIDVEPREPPSVDITPNAPQTHQLGAQGMLYCSANGIPEPTIQWRRTDGKQLSSRHREEGPGYIIINDIQIADAGEYECVAENSVGRATGIATLRVVEQPTIELNPNDQVLRVTEGDEIRITCSANGYPSPSVRWLKINEPDGVLRGGEAEHLNQALLEIYRAEKSDSRTYKCIARNEAGIDERSITVVVQQKRGDIGEQDGDVERDPYKQHYIPITQRPLPYEPPAQSSLPKSNQLSANLGDDVTLTCDLTAPTYLETHWVRADGRPLPSNSYNDRNSLKIKNVEEQNFGEYRCNVVDNRGNIVTYVTRELVLIPLPHITLHPRMPMEVSANDNVEIYCEVRGEQPISVFWKTDNNRPLPSSVRIEGPYLRFVSITPADAGGYRCIASNVYGNHSKTAQVVVRHPDYYSPLPRAQHHERNEGEDIQLSCDVQDSLDTIRGEIKYEWRRDDGRPLSNNAIIRNQILYLRSVRKEDEGRYICETHTRSGARSAPSYIDLYITPGSPTNWRPPLTAGELAPEPSHPRELSLKLDQQSSNLRVGESTEVECYSSDNSYTEVIWERADGRPLSENIQQIGNRLIISDVDATDAGNYVCKCKTDKGDLYTTSYALAIEESPHELQHPAIVHAEVGSSAQLKCIADEIEHSTFKWSRQYGQMQPNRDLVNEILTLNDVQAKDAGTYICTSTNDQGETNSNPVILVVMGAIPHFHQKPLSYMSFPTLPDSYIKFNFEITFRPEFGFGLLLFNGQKRGSGDYIALSLKNNYPEFHFDFDGKPLFIRAEQPITLNKWHTVRVTRFRRDGYMQVDEQHPVAFPTLSHIAPLDLIEDLYIGGVPNWDMLPAEAIEQEAGFVGCISRLTLQGTTIELMKEAKLKEGITSCQPCAQNPCANTGICLESQTELAYTCICKDGWTGRNCAIKGTQCAPGICGAGRCENTEIDMECLCPLNRTGDRCQYIEHLNEQSLNFKRNSYAAYSTPRASRLNIKFSIRPNSLQDAVLLYAAESKLPSGDFIAVILRNGHVELIINTGARLKPVIVRSINALILNKWTEIEISRRFGEGILRTGDEREQKAKASGLARTLYIKTPLYMGGYDRANVKLNPDVNITNGFDGCISKLFDAQRFINLIADLEDAANIQNCGEINEVDDHELYKHDEEKSSSNIRNNETDVFDNERYIQKEDFCTNEPCENGGICAVINGKASCSCLLGFAGKYCDEHISINFNASFRGNGYLEINRNQFDERVDQEYSYAAIVFSTSKPNGLLLWWGQTRNEEYTGQDFIALAIVDGLVEYSVRLNGEEVVIHNLEKRIDDGRRHIVLIKRTDNTAILELDHVMYAGETRPTNKKSINLPGHVFIGGIPNIGDFTGRRYLHNFDGCIHVVEGDKVGQIKLGTAAINGINVNTCTIEDETPESTEPPIV